MHKLLKFSLRLIYVLAKAIVISFLIISCLCILAQDYLIFSQLLVEPRDHPPRDPKTLPVGVESIALIPEEGVRVELWRVAPAHSSSASNKRVALLFHGNGGRIDNFYPYLEWFSQNGFVAYGLEYRGFGASSGWPSVKAISKDSLLAAKTIAAREGVSEAEIMPVGVSLGTGFAAILARAVRSEQLVLVAPYSSIREVAASRDYFWYLAPFVWNNIDSKNLVSELADTCVVAFHGRLDGNIRFENSLRLKAAYRGTSSYRLFEDVQGNHDDQFPKMQEKLLGALEECPSKRSK